MAGHVRHPPVTLSPFRLRLRPHQAYQAWPLSFTKGQYPFMLVPMAFVQDRKHLLLPVCPPFLYEECVLSLSDSNERIY